MRTRNGGIVTAPSLSRDEVEPGPTPDRVSLPTDQAAGRRPTGRPAAIRGGSTFAGLAPVGSGRRTVDRDRLPDEVGAGSQANRDRRSGRLGPRLAPPGSSSPASTRQQIISAPTLARSDASIPAHDRRVPPRPRAFQLKPIAAASAVASRVDRLGRSDPRAPWKPHAAGQATRPHPDRRGRLPVGD